MKQGRLLVSVVICLAMVASVNAVNITTQGTIDTPTALTPGSYVLESTAVTTYGLASLVTNSATEFGWSLTGSWAEGGIYYAFSAPAGSKVTLNGKIADTTINTGIYWSEANLYKADDLSAAVALNSGKNLLTDADYDDESDGKTTQQMWDAGWGYFMSGPAALDVADALYNYSGNSESLAANADQGVGGQPVCVFNDETAGGIPADDTSFTDSSVAYSWSTGLARPMKESLIATPSNLVVANTDTALTEYILWMKGGAQNIGISTILSDVTIGITQLLGDANLDDVVDGTDFNALLTNWGAVTGDNWTKADFNVDGVVDGTDFNYILSNWSAGGGAPPTLADVPEPATMSLLVVISGIALIRRKRQ